MLPSGNFVVTDLFVNCRETTGMSGIVLKDGKKNNLFGIYKYRANLLIDGICINAI